MLHTEKRVLLDAEFVKGEGVLEDATYADGSLAVIFHTEEEPPMTITVRLVDRPAPPEGCAWVRDYGYQEGLPATLIVAGAAVLVREGTTGPFSSAVALMRFTL